MTLKSLCLSLELLMTRKWWLACETWALTEIFREPAGVRKGSEELRGSRHRDSQKGRVDWKKKDTKTDRETQHKKRMLVSWNVSCGKLRVRVEGRKESENTRSTTWLQHAETSLYSLIHLNSLSNSSALRAKVQVLPDVSLHFYHSVGSS